APIEAAPRWPLTPPFAPAVSHLAGPSPVSAARDTRHNWKPVTADQSRPRKIGSAGCPSWYSTDVSGGRLRPPELLEMAAAMLLVSTGAVGDGTRHVAHVVLGVATLTFAVAGRLRHVSRVVYGVSAPVWHPFFFPPTSGVPDAQSFSRVRASTSTRDALSAHGIRSGRLPGRQAGPFGRLSTAKRSRHPHQGRHPSRRRAFRASVRRM